MVSKLDEEVGWARYGLDFQAWSAKGGKLPGAVQKGQGLQQLVRRTTRRRWRWAAARGYLRLQFLSLFLFSFDLCIQNLLVYSSEPNCFLCGCISIWVGDKAVLCIPLKTMIILTETLMISRTPCPSRQLFLPECKNLFPSIGQLKCVPNYDWWR